MLDERGGECERVSQRFKRRFLKKFRKERGQGVGLLRFIIAAEND